jgi:MinD superfamily P-loop ATPase
MKIAVLSGKGGTGKTTVSTNLSFVNKDIVLIDCDVEEPNASIFLKPIKSEEEKVFVEYPVVVQEKCVLCGKCGEICKFNAIIPAKNTVLVFKESCHSCGGCQLVCPVGAIKYEKREIGKIVKGKTIFNNYMEYGLLNIGELSGVNIIKTLKNNVKDEKLVIIDSPPGTSCATVSAVEYSDFAIIVTEPTPFGLNDMKMVVEMLREMGMPFGVFVNKADLGDMEVYDYCREENIEILGEIPFDKDIANYYSKGEIFSKYIPHYKEVFENLLQAVLGGKNGN